MKRFFNEVKKYFYYTKYAALSELKTEVANSYLNWLWWILDPLAFMIIYSFISIVVFGKKEAYFPVFVFLGLTCWGFFNWMLTGSVKLINNNKHILSKIYIPKYILLIEKSFVYLFKTFISFLLVILLIIVFKVPITINYLYFFPLLILLYLISFAFGLFMMHFGVYVEDLQNLTGIVLKMMFYLSGIFYSVSRIKVNPTLKFYLLNLNPIAFIIDQVREVIIYAKSPNFLMIFLWYIIAISLIMLGVSLIQKNENNYAKVM